MNYSALENMLNSDVTLDTTSEQEIISHFQTKHKTVPFNDDFLFVFNHDRQFQGKNHIISFHKRNAGKVPMHIYHYIVITYVYSGTLSIIVEDEEIVLHKGDLIIFDKHVPHSVKRTSENDLGINIVLNEAYFSKKFINHLPNDKLISQFMFELMNNKNNHNHYLLFFTQNDELTHNCIQNILCEYLDSTICSDDLIDNFIMILITHLVRKFQYQTNLSIDMFRNQQLMEDILVYIRSHYIEGNLKNMCTHFGYDPSYTSKLIKKFSGKTFKQLVNDERMKKAIILLHNKRLPIYEIAETIGINNLTAFYKRFYEYAGCSPQEYRDRYKK
ncbi:MULTISPECIES: AraC family transcriptional regulator [unclassified Clostridium]|uniref:AraC family transcriptional regulator n=1 Tax=unclassified Clostridium TaxID=2614128 RepID=UPI001EED96D4|nr:MULTISPECIES: helix-turn-helix domain-containing protein [unclassified Clostridium]